MIDALRSGSYEHYYLSPLGTPILATITFVASFLLGLMPGM